MNTRIQPAKIFLSILVIFILSCGPLSEVRLTPANPGGTPPAPGTESSNATTLPKLSDIISFDNAKNLVEISSWGKGSGHHPTYSPDGGLIAVSSSSGIYLYDSQTLQENLRLAASHDVFQMAFSPDGKTLSELSGYHFESAVRQWDLSSGSELNSWTVALDYNGGQGIATLSADGKMLATLTGTYEDGKLILWDVASGQELHSLSVFYAENLALSPDGKILASAAYPGVILWDVASGSQIRTLDLEATFISLTFSPDGKTLATGPDPASTHNSELGTVQLWEWLAVAN